MSRDLDPPIPVTEPQGSDDEMLDDLQRETFDYFLIEVNPQNGLVVDKTGQSAPSSIAVVGLALTAYPIGVERGFMSREDAIQRTLTTLKFFYASPQGPEPDATGYKGFYYHFLDMRHGRRMWQSELSTIDTAIFIAGALTAAQYFDRNTGDEVEIRKLADALYRRIDWQWALNGETTFSHGWKPESGFIPYRWNKGYSEAHILYLLAMGSPTFPIAADGYKSWTETFEKKNHYELEYIYAGPLFIHQMSQLWIDFRGIRDAANKRFGCDYFENSYRATHAQRKYAIENPLKFMHYSDVMWGFTASDGPGPAAIDIDGSQKIFYDYIARGAPQDIDDGTISPWAVVASIPFAPEIVICTIRHYIECLNLKKKRFYGFDASFNPTFPERKHNPHGWVSHWRFGLNQGPIVIMLENYRSGQIWKLMKNCPYLQTGLSRAGFEKFST